MTALKIHIDFKRHIRQLCPNALIHALEGDHYLMQEKIRVEAIATMDLFFNCCRMDGYSDLSDCKVS